MKNVREKLDTVFYLAVFLMLSLIGLYFFAPGFFTMNNTMSILNRFSYIVIAAIGMNLIIITGNIDVSSGAIISVVCITIALIGKKGAAFPVLLFIAMITGIILSSINSFFVTKAKIPAIVATLATSQLFSGILPLIVEGSIYDLPESYTWFGFKAKVFGVVPASVPLALAIIVIFVLFMHYSRYSKRLYAVGNNKAAAYLAGVKNNRIITIAYVLAGALFGISGVIIGTASERVTATMGSGLNMTFIAAVVLGGTSVNGGSGKIMGTVFGALILSLIAPATNYLKISTDWSDAIMGFIIIIAVIINAVIELRDSKAKAMKAVA